MHNPEYVLENNIHKILLDFEIRTAHQFPDRRLDEVLTTQKKKETAIL